MAKEVFNRYEIKYMISDEIYHIIRPCLEDYMEVDLHSRNGEFYHICNVYYDTPQHDIVRRSINKPVYKEKLRLRSYGAANLDDRVYLEIKKKCNGIVNKRRTSIKLSEAYQYIKTKEKPELKTYMNGQVLNEIDYMLQRYDLMPMLYLTYDRNALYNKDDDSFRVTFDTNIKTRRDEVGLDTGNHGDNLLPPGVWVMETKVEKSVPIWFTRLLSTYKIYPASFSKYGMEYQKNILGKSIPADY